MMNFENIGTGLIDVEALPWVPFAPYSNDVFLKLIKADPVRGETITMMKAPISMELTKHHHSGTVIVYTIAGAWKYKEHDWIARPGSVVFETAGSSHAPIGIEGHGDELITLNITVGDLVYLDDNDQVLAIETWRTAVDRYLQYCRDNGIEAQDVTSFAE